MVYLDFEAQERDSTFTFLHTLSKKAILLHILGLSDPDLCPCVYMYPIFDML